MIRMRFGTDALAHVRFAVSPLIETHGSVKVLHDDAGGQALHAPWSIEARRHSEGLDLSVLRALQPHGVYTPDFVHPPPSGPLAELDDELARMAATPAGEVRAEVRESYHGRALPPVLTPFLTDPDAAVGDLASLIRVYWDRTLAGHWPRIRALLEGDVLYRARQIADGGAQRLFADIDPTVRWADDVLSIDKCADETIELDERGLLFVPSVFVWPAVLIITEPPWQPTIIYPARGVGMLWETARPVAPEALASLLGRTRAAILFALGAPRSTTDLARTLGASAGGISQHLAILRDAGLVNAHRTGRVVLYLRSPTAEDLLTAASPPDPAAQRV
jgi:DNA-binding transcriptional ArsR family regulator